MSMKNLTSVFTNIANAIRSKSGKSAKIEPSDMASEIIGLPSGSGGITPTGTIDIKSNGTHDVTTYANANVNVPIPSGYIKPFGTKDVTSNGTHDVGNYKNVNVDVPIPTMPTISDVVPTFTDNGTYMASGDGFDGYSGVKVEVYVPDISDVVPTFSSNGTYMASADGFDGYKGVKVEVDPPTGTKYITSNGTHDVTNVAKANVNVPRANISETIPTFSSNGTYMASADGFDGYKGVKVEVDPPTGTKYITSNGTHDVTNFAKANVNVPRANISETIPTFSSNGTYLASADGFEGYKGVKVEVSKDVNLQGKTVYSNGFVYPDEGYDGLEYVDVAIPSQVKTITKNGTYNADENGNFSSVIVNVPTDSGNVPPMLTAQLLITGSAYTGDEVCIPYYENGELKHCYGYESLGAMMTDGWVTFEVPLGAMVMLRNVSFTKNTGTFEDVSGSFSFLGSEAGWYIMTDATELSLNS